MGDFGDEQVGDDVGHGDIGDGHVHNNDVVGSVDSLGVGHVDDSLMMLLVLSEVRILAMMMLMTMIKAASSRPSTR